MVLLSNRLLFVFTLIALHNSANAEERVGRANLKCGESGAPLVWPDELRAYAKKNQCEPVTEFCKNNYSSSEWQFGYGAKRNRGVVVLCQKPGVGKRQYFVLVKTENHESEIAECPNVIPLSNRPDSIAVIAGDQVSNLVPPGDFVYLDNPMNHPKKDLGKMHDGIQVGVWHGNSAYYVFYCFHGAWLIYRGFDS